MIIKLKKHSYIFIGLLIGCFLGFACFLLCMLGKEGIWCAIALTVVGNIISIPYSMVTCRTLNFDLQGCTISFLGIRKFTPWSQIVIRQEEIFNNAITYPGKFAKKPDAGAVFSSKKKERPWWLGPEAYCILRNPFTTFFVVHREENPKAMILSAHVVNRENFLATLASFDIELKNAEKKEGKL